MVIQELRKIFWKRKLLLALALVLLFEGLLAWRGADGIFSSTQDKRVYMDLLQSYAGDLTPEKRERLDQELETYEKAQELMVQAEEQYQNGELTSEGFDARTAELAPYRANLAARSDFAEAAQYAEAKPGRTLVNQLAWNELFDTDRVDFLLSVLLILFAILAFVSEDETDFRQIKQYNGPRELDHGIEKMREHGIMRLSKGRSANHVIQNVHVGIQGEGSH